MKIETRPFIGTLTGIAAGLGLVACENLPGTREQQATGAGGAAGAAVGAAVAENELVGALLGGVAGAAGGRLVGARTDWFEEEQDERSSRARDAIAQAQRDPATPEDVEDADTADLNGDGFVTTDELLAMEQAGLADGEIIERLRATDQVFDLGDEQREQLVAAGMSRNVVEEMEQINREERDSILSRPEVVGQSPA